MQKNQISLLSLNEHSCVPSSLERTVIPRPVKVVEVVLPIELCTMSDEMDDQRPVADRCGAGLPVVLALLPFPPLTLCKVSAVVLLVLLPLLRSSSSTDWPISPSTESARTLGGGAPGLWLCRGVLG